MTKLVLDVLDSLVARINETQNSFRCRIGVLDREEDMTIMAMPGGAELEFMDGSRDKNYQVQANIKTKSQPKAINTLNVVSSMLERETDLPSSNGSYEFNRIRVTSLPSLLGVDESNNFIYVVSLSVEITIKKGVVEQWHELRTH